VTYVVFFQDTNPGEVADMTCEITNGNKQREGSVNYVWFRINFS